jgi:hypothetical protein
MLQQGGGDAECAAGLATSDSISVLKRELAEARSLCAAQSDEIMRLQAQNTWLMSEWQIATDRRQHELQRELDSFTARLGMTVEDTAARGIDMGAVLPPLPPPPGLQVSGQVAPPSFEPTLPPMHSLMPPGVSPFHAREAPYSDFQGHWAWRASEVALPSHDMSAQYMGDSELLSMPMKVPLEDLTIARCSMSSSYTSTLPEVCCGYAHWPSVATCA